MAKAYYLTTDDNPFDPADDFDNWYKFDLIHGYHSCEYLARVSGASTNMTDAEYQRCINAAVDEICRLNVTGNYKRIVKDIEEPA